jgi:hypothetical protein
MKDIQDAYNELALYQSGQHPIQIEQRRRKKEVEDAIIAGSKKGWFERHPKTAMATSAVIGGFAWHILQKYLL